MINLSMALLMATLLNRKMFGCCVFRAVFYLPSIVAGVSILPFKRYFVQGIVTTGLKG